MLPPGEKKRPNEYDHASGCPQAVKITEAQRRALVNIAPTDRPAKDKVPGATRR